MGCLMQAMGSLFFLVGALVVLFSGEAGLASLIGVLLLLGGLTFGVAGQSRRRVGEGIELPEGSELTQEKLLDQLAEAFHDRYEVGPTPVTQRFFVVAQSPFHGAGVGVERLGERSVVTVRRFSPSIWVRLFLGPWSRVLFSKEVVERVGAHLRQSLEPR